MLPENAAKIIQSHFRRLIERRSFLKMVNAVSFLQIVIRAWLTVRKKSAFVKFDTIQVKGLSSGMCCVSNSFICIYAE